MRQLLLFSAVSALVCGCAFDAGEDIGDETQNGEAETLGSTAEAITLDETYAVGVTPIDGVTCPVGSPLVRFYIDMEDDGACYSFQGWNVPQAAVPSPFCGTSSYPYGTDLRFCKVNGQSFKAMTRNPADTSQFYAVLKLGQYCPNGSVQVTKYIDTEDDYSVYWDDWGPIAPNTHNKYGINLNFCLFQAVSASTPIMTAFPNVGNSISYAVMHDYGGAQPPWILSKYYIYQDDEDDGNANRYTPSSGTSYINFNRIIGGGANTTFEFGQVR